MPRMTKRDGCGLVPSKDLRASIADMLSTWESCPQLAVDLQFREALLVTWKNTHDSPKVVSPMMDILGDLGRIPGCCCSPTPILQLWHTRKVLSPAVEVFACAQIMYRIQMLEGPTVAEKYMQRALGLFLTTDFDEYVQAVFLACFSRFLQFRQGSAHQEARWKNDAWDFLLYTSELHLQCGMVELSLVNLLSASKLRLQMSTGRPSSAAIVEKLLRGIDHLSLGHLPDRRLAHRMALILRARQLQGPEVASKAEWLAEAVGTGPGMVRKEVAERLPLTHKWLMTEGLPYYLLKHAHVGDLRRKLNHLEVLIGEELPE